MLGYFHLITLLKWKFPEKEQKNVEETLKCRFKKAMTDTYTLEVSENGLLDVIANLQEYDYSFTKEGINYKIELKI